jgi:DNA-binding MarR family transcriptional regulator
MLDKSVNSVYAYIKGEIMDNRKKQLLLDIHEIYHEIEDVNSNIMKFGTDVKLTREEIHLIKAIEENPGSHVIKLAQVLDISKAAISNKLKRLKNKGIITKTVDDKNKSKLIIGLTEKGKKAYLVHNSFHKNFYNSISNIFSDYTEEEMKFLLQVAKRTKKALEEFQSTNIE